VGTLNEKGLQTFQASQLISLTIVIPAIPGAAMASKAGIVVTAAFAFVALMALMLIERTRSLLEDAIWYRCVVGYFFLSTLALGAARVFQPSLVKAATVYWLIGAIAVVAAAGHRWLDAVKRY
jgi:hypothetical protein